MMAAVANGFSLAGVAAATVGSASPPHSALHQPPHFAAGDDIPNDPGKMFIGGLSWQTTPESIREYFSSFGELAEVMVMKDPATRRSRGFGFITFSDPRSVEDVLKYPVHQLDGKLVEPKVAVPRKTNPKLVMRTRKIFVGGLSATTSLEDIKAYFEQFSLVKEAMLAYDKVTSRHRGFGFVTFDNEDVVDKICEIHFHEINGKMVESKKALPKEPRLGYYGNVYGSPSGHIGYGQYSPGRQGGMFGAAYGSYMGSGSNVGSANGRFPQGHHHHQYNSASGYDHRGDHQDRTFLQMGQFDNANYGYEGGNEMRYYNGGSGTGQGSKYGMGGNGGSPGLQQRQYGMAERGYDIGSSGVGGNISRPNANGFGSCYRETRSGGGGGVGGGIYDNVRSAGGVNRSSIDIGGSFGDMLSNGYYSSSDRDFVSSNGHHVSGGGGGGSTSNGHSGVVVQPYSTSAGSGGSGENSNGYEDDFPELTASKFNNLRLDDSSPTSTPNDLNQNLVGGRNGAGPSSSSAFVAF